MLGGHLDSWHSATGATDNAIGCAVMMEAARILQGDRRQAAPHDSRRALGRRRAGPAGIEGLRRAALRHGRESEAGVREVQRLLQRRRRHGPHPRRIDLRTARSRATSCASTSGSSRTSASTARPRRPAARPAAPTARRSTRRVCRASASARIRSNTTATPGTPTSTRYERIVEDDVKKSAIAIASAVYHVAMRDEMLPRFAPDAMPPVPAPAAAAARRQRRSGSGAGRTRRAWRRMSPGPHFQRPPRPCLKRLPVPCLKRTSLPRLPALFRSPASRALHSPASPRFSLPTSPPLPALAPPRARSRSSSATRPSRS